MRTRWLFWDEDEVQKKKTLVLALAILLIILLLSFYAALGREGGLIAEVTPTAPPSPGAVTTPTLPVPTSTLTPPASATPEAMLTAGLPEPTIASPTSEALEPTLTLISEATATPLFTPTPVPLEPTPTPTIVLTATLPTPVITTPSHGDVLNDDRPAIAGIALPNTTVQVYDDENPIGVATADAQGDWALLPDKPLEPGEHTVTAVASDDTGRTSTHSEAVTFTIAIERLPTTGGSWFERWLNGLLP